MSSNYHIINCKLCGEPVGINFDKPDDNTTYCYLCAETMIKFANSFNTDFYANFANWFDLDCDRGLKHRYRIASKFYLNNLKSNSFNEILYKKEN